MARTARLRPPNRPCAECPWRLDQPPGRFGAERFELLRDTSSGPRGESAPPDAPMFACHKTAQHEERPCAGWLAVEGRDHIGVRIAVLQGRLVPEVLEAGQGWPELFASFAAMAAANHAAPDHDSDRAG